MGNCKLALFVVVENGFPRCSRRRGVQAASRRRGPATAAHLSEFCSEGHKTGAAVGPHVGAMVRLVTSPRRIRLRGLWTADLTNVAAKPAQ